MLSFNNCENLNERNVDPSLQASIRQLDISYCYITDLRFIFNNNLVNIQILNASYNLISEYKHLKNLENLNSLTLNYNNLQYLDQLPKLNKLQTLNVSCNNIHSILPLQQLFPQLHYLIIKENINLHKSQKTENYKFEQHMFLRQLEIDVNQNQSHLIENIPLLFPNLAILNGQEYAKNIKDCTQKLSIQYIKYFHNIDDTYQQKIKLFSYKTNYQNNQLFNGCKVECQLNSTLCQKLNLQLENIFYYLIDDQICTKLYENKSSIELPQLLLFDLNGFIIQKLAMVGQFYSNTMKTRLSLYLVSEDINFQKLTLRDMVSNGPDDSGQQNTIIQTKVVEDQLLIKNMKFGQDINFIIQVLLNQQIGNADVNKVELDNSINTTELNTVFHIQILNKQQNKVIHQIKTHTTHFKLFFDKSYQNQVLYFQICGFKNNIQISQQLIKTVVLTDSWQQQVFCITCKRKPYKFSYQNQNNNVLFKLVFENSDLANLKQILQQIINGITDKQSDYKLHGGFEVQKLDIVKDIIKIALTSGYQLLKDEIPQDIDQDNLFSLTVKNMQQYQNVELKMNILNHYLFSFDLEIQDSPVIVIDNLYNSFFEQLRFLENKNQDYEILVSDKQFFDYDQKVLNILFQKGHLNYNQLVKQFQLQVKDKIFTFSRLQECYSDQLISKIVVLIHRIQQEELIEHQQNIKLIQKDIVLNCYQADKILQYANFFKQQKYELFDNYDEVVINVKNISRIAANKQQQYFYQILLSFQEQTCNFYTFEQTTIKLNKQLLYNYSKFDKIDQLIVVQYNIFDLVQTNKSNNLIQQQYTKQNVYNTKCIVLNQFALQNGQTLQFGNFNINEDNAINQQDIDNKFFFKIDDIMLKRVSQLQNQTIYQFLNQIKDQSQDLLKMKNIYNKQVFQQFLTELEINEKGSNQQSLNIYTVNQNNAFIKQITSNNVEYKLQIIYQQENQRICIKLTNPIDQHNLQNVIYGVLVEKNVAVEQMLTQNKLQVQGKISQSQLKQFNTISGKYQLDKYVLVATNIQNVSIQEFTKFEQYLMLQSGNNTSDQIGNLSFFYYNLQEKIFQMQRQLIKVSRAQQDNNSNQSTRFFVNQVQVSDTLLNLCQDLKIIITTTVSISTQQLAKYINITFNNSQATNTGKEILACKQINQLNIDKFELVFDLQQYHFKKQHDIIKNENQAEQPEKEFAILNLFNLQFEMQITEDSKQKAQEMIAMMDNDSVSSHGSFVSKRSGMSAASRMSRLSQFSFYNNGLNYFLQTVNQMIPVYNLSKVDYDMYYQEQTDNLINNTSKNMMKHTTDIKDVIFNSDLKESLNILHQSVMDNKNKSNMQQNINNQQIIAKYDNRFSNINKHIIDKLMSDLQQAPVFDLTEQKIQQFYKNIQIQQKNQLIKQQQKQKKLKNVEYNIDVSEIAKYDQNLYDYFEQISPFHIVYSVVTHNEIQNKDQFELYQFNKSCTNYLVKIDAFNNDQLIVFYHPQMELLNNSNSVWDNFDENEKQIQQQNANEVINLYKYTVFVKLSVYDLNTKIILHVKEQPNKSSVQLIHFYLLNQQYVKATLQLQQKLDQLFNIQRSTVQLNFTQMFIYNKQGLDKCINNVIVTLKYLNKKSFVYQQYMRQQKQMINQKNEQQQRDECYMITVNLEQDLNIEAADLQIEQNDDNSIILIQKKKNIKYLLQTDDIENINLVVVFIHLQQEIYKYEDIKYVQEEQNNYTNYPLIKSSYLCSIHETFNDDQQYPDRFEVITDSDIYQYQKMLILHDQQLLFQKQQELQNVQLQKQTIQQIKQLFIPKQYDNLKELNLHHFAIVGNAGFYQQIDPPTNYSPCFDQLTLQMDNIPFYYFDYGQVLNENDLNIKIQCKDQYNNQLLLNFIFEENYLQLISDQNQIIFETIDVSSNLLVQFDFSRQLFLQLSNKKQGLSQNDVYMLEFDEISGYLRTCRVLLAVTDFTFHGLQLNNGE